MDKDKDDAQLEQVKDLIGRLAMSPRYAMYFIGVETIDAEQTMLHNWNRADGGVKGNFVCKGLHVLVKTIAEQLGESSQVLLKNMIDEFNKESKEKP